MMHIIKTFFERLVLGVFSGSRRPSKFSEDEPIKPSRNASAAERTKYGEDRRKYEADKAEYNEALKAFDECCFDVTSQRIVDERVQNLAGFPYWIRSTMVHTRTFNIKS